VNSSAIINFKFRNGRTRQVGVCFDSGLNKLSCGGEMAMESYPASNVAEYF
jgi:hypothetical protein